MKATISPTPNEVLQALLIEHGYEAKVSQNRVVVLRYAAQMSGEVFHQQQSDPAHVQLDVRLHLPDGRTLVESCSGIGPTLKHAMGDGFSSFCRSSFHVLLQAFFNGSPEAAGETWRTPRGGFTAFIGDVTFRGAPPIEDEELIRWFDTFATQIQGTPLTPTQSHWIRLYYAQHEGKTIVCEVLLNNESWPEMRNTMSVADWPVGEAFYSARIFLVLQPNS